MGRPKGRVKALRMRLRVRGARRRTRPRRTGLDDLTLRFRQRRARMYGDAVDAVAELGRILIEGRERVPGRFLKWLDELEIEQATAARYMRLARLAEEDRGLVRLWKSLGTTKLYRIASIPDDARTKVLRPSERPRLHGMNDREFAAHTKPLLKRKRKTTVDMSAHGLRMQAQAWTDELKESAVAGIQSGSIREGLRDDLGALIREARRVLRMI